MTRNTSAPGLMAWPIFLLVVVIGGGNFVAVRVSNTELPPFWGAGLRFGIAAILFMATALLLRLAWPRGRQLWMLALYGLFSFTISYALMYWALVRVTAGMSTVLLAVVPLVTPLLAVAHRMGKLEVRSLIGAVAALGGIVVMTVGGGGIDVPPSGLAAIGLAALALGESVIIGKKVSVGHPAMTNAVGMPIGAAGLLLVSLVAGEQWALPRQADVAWSLAYLILIGSVGLFALFLLVIRQWSPAASSYAFVLFPVVTLLLEAALLDEPLTGRAVIGAVVVMAGVWFGALAPRRQTGTLVTAGSDLEPADRLQRGVSPAEPLAQVLERQAGDYDRPDGYDHEHGGEGVEGRWRGEPGP